MNESISLALKDWIPYRLLEEAESYSCRWLYLGDEKITDPFFDETIARCKRLSHNSRMTKCVSSIEILPEWAQQVESISPTAIIFHISRCGSTLVSQLLSLQSSNIVLSEVPLFDELLRWGNRNNEMQMALPLLTAAIDLYGKKRDEESKYLFIKTDSWHIHFYQQFRKLYPQTPFILLYRKPDEVVRSQQKRRGMQCIPRLLEPEIFGFNKSEILAAGLDGYMVRVIESYLQAFIEVLNTDKLAFPVNYNEGAICIVNKIAGITGITINDKQMSAMRRRSAFHAKYPEQAFVEEELKEPAPVFLNKAFELYNEIEKIRHVKATSFLD